jgi:hypothetical protein
MQLYGQKNVSCQAHGCFLTRHFPCKAITNGGIKQREDCEKRCRFYASDMIMIDVTLLWSFDVLHQNTSFTVYNNINLEYN